MAVADARQSPETAGLSLLTRFDDLGRNANVLFQSSEEEFLRFVVNIGVARRRWENAELECQRLNIELTKASQENQSLEQKLLMARSMLDSELSLRKRAEQERDRLQHKLNLFRQIVLHENVVDEMTMEKIRNIEQTENRSEILATITSPWTLRQPSAGILKNNNANNVTDSVYDIDDLSFDDTRELCESRSRVFDTTSDQAARQSRSKRSRSGSRHRDPEDREDRTGLVLEDIASPRKDAEFAGRKKARRSRSVVTFDAAAGDEDTDVELQRSQRTYSLTEGSASKQQQQQRRDSLRPRVNGRLSVSTRQTLGAASGEQLHNFVQKTVLKPEKCSVCPKRIKFGKIYIKCTGCRMTVHNECSDKAPPLCARCPSPEVSVTPRADSGGGGGGLARTPSKKAYFASPMLR